jgi:diadenosine tetraphosphate (Ap4A) HIT family hydrolase
MDNWKKDRIASAVKGENPTVVTKMKSGFVVFHDWQFLSGYCILIAYPKVGSLNDLSIEERTNFLMDMTLIGDAIKGVCNPFRINYEILGNKDNFLHAHIYPRYEWEDEDKRKSTIYHYPREVWNDENYYFTEEKHGRLKKQLSEKLEELMELNYK